MDRYFGYSEKIPEGARDIFMWLCQDVASLHDKWTIYKGLYSDPAITDLITYIAKDTFRTIEESLRNDMTMSICRLCDPASSFGHKNVSFKALLELEKIQTIYRFDIEGFIKTCDPVVQLRNKRVAHNDKNTLLNPKENLLPGISKSLIDRIVNTAGEVLNRILALYDNSEMGFESLAPGTVDTLVFWLREAKEYSDKERRERGY